MTPTIDEALHEHALLGAALGLWHTWTAWLAVLRAAFGLPLDTEQLAMFAAVAGDRKPPAQRVRELWAICGRRAGKSKIAAAIAIYLALFVKHKLSLGERGMVLVLAASQDQARVVFDYAKAFLESSPVLAQEIEEITRNEIRLVNGIVISTHANTYRTVRGRTLVAAIFDEVAIWRDELSATPDVETYSAVLPSLLTTKGMLIGISTGYRKARLTVSEIPRAFRPGFRRHSCRARLDTAI
jgi:phage terminase large subunit-like protein